MNLKIVMPATVVELMSGAINTDQLPRARIRVFGASDFSRDLTILNLVNLKLDQKLKLTFTSDDDVEVETPDAKTNQT